MKVGTDGVLLGLWTAPPAQGAILDVGTGSGLVALMLAQRAPGCRVDAVELDGAAASQARANFDDSPFAGRLAVHQGAIQDFEGGPYRLLVSNPPFFHPGQQLACEKRAAARHFLALPPADFAKAAQRLLAEDGELALVLPWDEQQRWLAALDAFQLRRRCAVSTVEGRAPKRVLLQLSRLAGPLEESALALRRSDQNWTNDFLELGRDFYLHF
ncbi:methyltransferase [Gallaecimonas sp. GXIMD4217]|uniref:tRNA1(Val) (adenine(37)-N6)-methyltransferase n=1 Tax=Gallaecimonas sp. GXIMD4217 TaxID=3131927 RepID=UPI00311B1E8B